MGESIRTRLGRRFYRLTICSGALNVCREVKLPGETRISDLVDLVKRQGGERIKRIIADDALDRQPPGSSSQGGEDSFDVAPIHG